MCDGSHLRDGSHLCDGSHLSKAGDGAEQKHAMCSCDPPWEDDVIMGSHSCGLSVAPIASWKPYPLCAQVKLSEVIKKNVIK